MKFWKFGMVACLLVLAGVLGWRFMYPSYEWRQKITVEVDTPQGPVSASSVSKMQAVFQPKLLPDIPPMKLHRRGEAVMLDIPERGFLFVLHSNGSTSEHSKFLATTVFRDKLADGSSRAIYSAIEDVDEIREIPFKHYPLLVTFDDIADPTTVKRVDPLDLVASFGPGVSLKRITLEITDEPVTEGKVRQTLPWLSVYPEPAVLPYVNLNDFSAEAKLRHGDFVRD